VAVARMDVVLWYWLPRDGRPVVYGSHSQRKSSERAEATPRPRSRRQSAQGRSLASG
jgi:hypothetical protein